MIASPLTGEILPDDLQTLERAERTVDRYLRGLSPHYDFRRRLRERIAELRGPAVLPRRRFQTEKQERVSTCPRCGGRHIEEVPIAGPPPEPNPFHDEESEAVTA